MIKHLKPILAPVLVSITPIIFLYSHNVKVLYLGNLVVPLLLATSAAAALYSLFYFFQSSTVSASLSAIIFLIINHGYGQIYNKLVEINRLPVDHFTLLPVVIVFAFYATYFFNFLIVSLREAILNVILVSTLVLVVYNAAVALPVEVQKAKLNSAETGTEISTGPASKTNLPDVYYIVFDEYAGFDVIRDYWKEDYVDEFELFLRDRRFFIADQSRSNTNNTLLEMATRLNFKPYPIDTDQITLYQDITDSKALRLFKSYGYTTVVFNSTFPQFNADFNFKIMKIDDGIGAAEFQQMLIENSMLDVFFDHLSTDSSSSITLQNIQTTFIKIPNLTEIQSPKFVYAHFSFPHMPFVVDQHGRVLDPKVQFNWNYYLGQHMYATQQAQVLVAQLLANAGQDNPPVIILQSDHGARNGKLPTQDSVQLENYPQEYILHILNALYLPGYDTSLLPTDLDPMESLVIVLNHYLNASVSVEN